MIERIVSFLLFMGDSSTFINAAVNPGLITNATKSEDDNTVIKVRGKYFMNSPKSPGQNASGKNAASVVAVEAMIGKATSPAPSFAAVMRS
ncbi:MAG: Uncharacterised protein [Flavobacteriales bacterium UBA4585]|nr:MAG: Uncharacterised protein [Flavobacteriales bacterium UBA4585]